MTDVLVILDGASEPIHGDEPTSLERAATPVLDALAQLGTLRRLRTTPAGLPAGSETGCAVLLGWRPPAAVDRASLEAAARELAVPVGSVARRVDVLSTAAPDPVPPPAIDRRGRQNPDPEAEPAPPLTPAPRRADAATTALAAELIRSAGAATGLEVHAIGGHRLLVVGEPETIGHALTTSLTGLAGAADLHIWPLGASVPRRLDERTVVIGAAGAVTGLARLLGARVVEPEGYDGLPQEPVSPLTDAALIALATGDAERIVIHVGAPDEAAHERNGDLKVSAIEAADEELLVPLASALHELGGVLEIAIDHGCDPRDGRHDGSPTPALRWDAGAEASEATGADAAGDSTREDQAESSSAGATDPRDIDPDAPGLRSGLDPEDLPVMALPKRRASAHAQTGRRLTERWVRPLPIEEPAGHRHEEPSP